MQHRICGHSSTKTSRATLQVKNSQPFFDFFAAALPTYTNIMLDGYHRTEAYLKYNETYADRLATLKDGETIPEPFDIIPCEYHRIPANVPVKLYAGSLSCKHGLRWADGDKKATASEVYEDNPGFSIKSLARYCGITEKTVVFD